MSEDLQDLDGWITDTIETLSPASRAKLLRRMGPVLRRNLQKRLSAQVGPDGKRWAARKDGSRRKMMRGLRLGRHLKIRSDSDRIRMGWRGRTGGIARVHHYGLRDRIRKKGIRVKYEQRELLGLSRTDTEAVSNQVTDWLTDS